jgi:hypothetical protein
MPTQSPPTASAPPAVDKSTKAGRGLRRFVAVLLALAITSTVGYAAISIYAATQLVHPKHVPIYATTQANAALWALTTTALISLLPVL